MTPEMESALVELGRRVDDLEVAVQQLLEAQPPTDPTGVRRFAERLRAQQMEGGT